MKGKAGRPRIREDVRVQVLEMHGHGLSFGEIAKELGIPRSTAWDVVRGQDAASIEASRPIVAVPSHRLCRKCPGLAPRPELAYKDLRLALQYETCPVCARPTEIVYVDERTGKEIESPQDARREARPASSP